MEAPLWALLLLPLPPLLASLCARCRRPRPPQRPLLDNYDSKPPLSAPPPPRFMVVTPRCAPPPHPPQPPWGAPREPRSLGPSQAPSSRRVSAQPDPDPLEDGDYTNEPFGSGYVTVLPDPTPPSDVIGDVMAEPGDVSVPGAEPEEGEGEEPYENVPEGEGGDSRVPSLEYINVPGAQASESDDGADYENL